MTLIKPVGKQRGRPFTGKDDPRRCQRPPGRPRNELCIPSLLKRIGSERLPESLSGKLPEQIEQSPDLLEAILRTTYTYALRGERWAVKFIIKHTSATFTQAPSAADVGNTPPRDNPAQPEGA